MVAKIIVKFVLFVISWVVSGVALFVALFSTCTGGKIYERIMEGFFIFFRFIVSIIQVFIQSRDIKRVAEAVSSTFSEMMKLSAQNIETNYKQVIIAFIVAYLSLKVVAGLISIIRRKIKLRNEDSKLPPVSKTPKHEEEPRTEVGSADKTVLTTGGY